MKNIAERMPDHAAHFNDDFRVGLEWERSALRAESRLRGSGGRR